MFSSTISCNRKSDQDHEIWEHLKQAIADCSGFKQWQSRQSKVMIPLLSINKWAVISKKL